MPKLRLIEAQSKTQPTIVEQPIVQQPIVQQPIVQQPTIDTSKYVTTEQLENTMGTVVDRLAKKIEPESALTPEVRGVVKAVDEIQGLRNALQSPTSAGIEIATSDLVTQVLTNALTNITGGGQQQAQPAPLRNTLAQIAISNLTGENSPLPQLLDSLTNIIGKDRVKDGYDVGVQYIDQQQKQNRLPVTIIQLDENSQEDVVSYAELMGYSDVQYAQTRLIEHKIKLYQEIEESQRIQQGGQQEAVIEEPIVQQERYEQAEYEKDHVDPQYSESLEPPRETIYNEEPIIEEPIIEEPIIEEPIIEEPIIEEPIIEEPIIEEPIKPKKLVLLNGEVEQDVNVIDDDKNNNDNESLNSDIDNIINEIGE